MSNSTQQEESQRLRYAVKKAMGLRSKGSEWTREDETLLNSGMRTIEGRTITPHNVAEISSGVFQYIQRMQRRRAARKTAVEGMEAVVTVDHDAELAERAGVSDALMQEADRSVRSIDSNQITRVAYVTLDSRMRTRNSNTRFHWVFAPDKIQPAQGEFCASTSMQNIRSIKIMPVRIPYVREADSTSNMISVAIDELSGQGYRSSNGRAFHFLFEATNNGDWIDLDPERFNKGVVKFSTPTTLRSITLSFGDIYTLIPFGPEYDTCTFTAYAATYIEVTTRSPHGLTNGDTVIFTNFSTDKPTDDYLLIDEMNNERGVVISGVVGVGSSTFQVNIVDAVPSAATPTAGLVREVYFASRRFIVNLEITMGPV